MQKPRAALCAATVSALAVAALGLTTPAVAQPVEEAVPGTPAAPWPTGSIGNVGKLVLELADGTIGVCSGAVVDAANGSVVATAAHCVQTQEDPAVPQDVWFLPGLERDAAAYRETGWKVASFHLPADWDINRQLSDLLPHDYAFLTLELQDGRTVQEVHGANRPSFEPVPESEQVITLGYPAGPPYDGETQHYCEGPTRVLGPADAAPSNVGGLLLENCGLNQGSSGGPWLQGYDPVTESGTLVAVTSVGSGEGVILGRPFPDAARALLDRAATAG
ncbi:trypsin-like peptidase domain-containing protein [Streptomyces sp. ACA25]|uniref:trypsin-like serine peptidase n=1 Tax=Streptomyces sp. ACA25 TaxID=3022596 RepID=UPI0023080950|nr:trypsin-like peptidase domain-containing protein [Streptomyces sp. ACA25]MDB1086061.1 trypsin-like peptidase domain-containing protein [Streptomyces sp. ACA25]